MDKQQKNSNNKKKKISVTTSKEIMGLVQTHMGLPDLQTKSRKREVAYAKKLVIKLSLRYTNETWHKIAKNLLYKSHASIKTGVDQYNDLKGQKIFAEIEEIYDKISREMDARIAERMETTYEYQSNIQIKKEFSLKIWKMNQLHHSIIKNLSLKIEQLQKENERLKKFEIFKSNGNI